ncbi:hypothetical protein CRYUN_Cryun16bG0101100 [Craigia yunnanensis]
MKAFCEKVKEKVGSDKYLALLEYIHQYSTAKIKTEGLEMLVNDLLGEYPGFFDEFLYVFNSSDGLTPSMESKEGSNKREKPGSEGVEEIDGCNKKIRLSSSLFQKPIPESTTRNKKKDHLFQALGFCEKVRKKTGSDEYLLLLKCLHDYGREKITLVDVKIMIADYFPDFMDDLDYALEFYGNITQLDEWITPSYQSLPKNRSGFHCSGITKLGKEVLNSSYFSKGSYGVHIVWPRDPDEEMLNEKEDELFERDMLMGWMRSTKENATKLYKAIKEGEIKKPTLEDVNNTFTGYNFRFIEKIYGKSGLRMVDRLRQSPEIYLPVLINRLNQMESLARNSFASPCQQAEPDVKSD